MEIFTRSLSFFVNGRKVLIEQPDPEQSLLYYLRRNLHLTGTKLSCNEGACGACTVMLSRYNPTSSRIKHYSVTACMVSICSLDGVAVTTIEGIGSTKTKLHPCQERIARCHGSQCGFCTPGMVMSMYTLLRNNPKPTEGEVEAALRGNLCRCTGYRPILDSFKSFCKDCTCKTMKLSTVPDIEVDKLSAIDDSQDPIFPPELKVSGSSPAPLWLKGPRVHWYRPVSLEQLLILRDRFPFLENGDQPQNRIVAGNTKLQCCGQPSIDHPEVLISVDSVPELKNVELKDNGFLIGAGVTLAELNTKLVEISDVVTEPRGRIFNLVLKILAVFGSPQIKNKVTLGGVVMTNSSSSDLLPILMTSEAKLVIASTKNRRELTLSVSCKEFRIEPNEVLISVCLPFSQESEYIAGYKQSRRKYMDAAIANACMWVRMDGLVVADCKIVFGNMAANHLVPAIKTMKAIVQREWNEELLSIACKTLSVELTLPLNAKGGMVEYRRCLCLSFFYKFFLFIKTQITTKSIPERDMSAIKPLSRQGPSKGSQGFQSVPSTQPIWNTIGKPMMHLSAIEQATGEAKYVDDTPVVEGELFAGFVLSECAHATFTVDSSALKQMKGIRGFVSAEDVPGSNKVEIVVEENLFADVEVHSVGQMIGIVIGEDKLTAQRGAKAVKVTYNRLPTILTIEDAIVAGAFYPTDRELKNGDVQTALADAEFCVEGSMRVGGQEHFYTETCSCVCTPKGEKREMEIVGSCQNLDALQMVASVALGVPMNKVTASVKRLGGAFGGKDSRSIPCYVAVAVAADKYQVPVRMVFERNEDIPNTGGRHPFKGVYKVGFDSKGKLKALDIDLYSNAGHCLDQSGSVMDHSIARFQNVYNIPNMRISGHTCRTNLPSNTAMRGYGSPQVHLIHDSIISHVADYLGINKDQVQETNLLQDGDKLVYGLEMKDCNVKKCWSTLKDKCQFTKKMSIVEEFNKNNKWKKRGISLMPTQYGLGAIFATQNQAGALVHIYTDGSVLLAHGGTEMGQGLHTKMVQVCSACLSIPVERIEIKDTDTNKVPNSTPTVASISSDMYGMAIKNACDQLNDRLKPFKESAPNAGWKAWVSMAYLARVNLSAQGFYKTPNVWMDWDKGIGQPFAYFSYGVGCSVVEIDALTGSFQVLSADLLMDVGNSLNPAIDIGQVEGAFVQGLGLFTMEEHVFLRDGRMHTVGPGSYKIPGCSDIPIEMNVTLLDNCPNPHAIFSSKGIGEPPLILAGSVFFAIKEAIKSARSESGITGHFEFWSPATAERIRMACCDQFVDMVKQDTSRNEESWNIIP